MKTPSLILASSSPRRVSYLKQLGYPFRQKHPEVDERPRSREKPRVYVRRIALEKARDLALQNPHSWVLAADTTVVVDEAILGKPRDDREAKKMLRKLSGRWHQVVSGMALVSNEKAVQLVATSVTRVRFRTMRESEIRWYVETGEPSDKAGAYAIQGKGGLFVKRIVGSPSNVVGFPVECFYDLVSKAGLPLPK
jgi:septum formation protein